MYFSDMAKVPRRYRLYSFPERETPLGRVHFGGVLPDSTGTGWDGFRKYGMYAAVLITRGGGVYRDTSGREIPLSEGSAILVFPEVPHHYGPGPGMRWDEVLWPFPVPPSMHGEPTAWIRPIRSGACRIPVPNRLSPLPAGQAGRKS